MSMFRPAFVSCFTVALFAGCATDAGEPIEIADEFVFGLSAEEVLAAKRVAQQPMSDEAWLDAHRGAFTCDRYGDLCAKIGAAAAERAIELGYRLAIEGADHAAVVRAQNEEIHAARVVWRDLEATVYNSDTEISEGSGGNGRRLKATVWATQMWPSLELQADGECRTQKNSFGWVAMNSDSICGDMTATFNGGAHVWHWDDCDFDDNVVEFAPHQIAASSLTTVIDCDADEGLWSASISADVSR
jgi:hypothetical protein